MNVADQVEPDQVHVLDRPDGRGAQAVRQPRDAIDIRWRRNALFDEVEDMSEVLERINENGGETGT